MKAAYCIEFTDTEVASVFAHMQDGDNGNVEYITEDQFVEYSQKA